MRPLRRITGNMRCLTCNGPAEALDHGDRWLVRCCDAECPAHDGTTQRKRFMPPSRRLRQNPCWVTGRLREREQRLAERLKRASAAKTKGDL